MDARILLRDVRAATASPKIVDITRAPRPSHRRWSSVKEDPAWQLTQVADRDETLRKRGEELWERAKRVKGVMTRIGGTQDVPKLAFERPARPLLGRVRVPLVEGLMGCAAFGGDSQERRSLTLTTRDEFEKIHAVFAA
ncbi:hypothetical protein HK104_005621 [Borealophlyctis nickersoniae]|nr:hypothetical protein HK104_005621 [Borealophlyctis nickersoniae]